MLLFDDSKKLEKALGEEAAAVIVHMFEKVNAENKQELVTKGHLELKLAELKAELTAEIAKARAETIKWTARLLMAQAAVVATLVKLL